MPIAYLLIRPDPPFRLESFRRGLQACGFTVDLQMPVRPARPGDVLITWNRYHRYHQAAVDFRRGGGTVLVTENGFIGRDENGRQLYQIARNFHAGFGSWHEGPEDRWSPLGIALKPWRTDGRHVLVCLQRGIGTAPVASPPPEQLARWATEALRLCGRPVVVRWHPETDKGRRQPPLEEQLAGAWCCVIWTSSAGVRALVEGVPVFYVAERWALESIARPGIGDLETPFLGERLPALRRLAWAQWRVSEIETGAPFRALCM
jgi:hypothetical protein